MLIPQIPTFLLDHLNIEENFSLCILISLTCKTNRTKFETLFYSRFLSEMNKNEMNSYLFWIENRLLKYVLIHPNCRFISDKSGPVIYNETYIHGEFIYYIAQSIAISLDELCLSKYYEDNDDIASDQSFDEDEYSIIYENLILSKTSIFNPELSLLQCLYHILNIMYDHRSDIDSHLSYIIDAALLYYGCTFIEIEDIINHKSSIDYVDIELIRFEH